MIFRLALTQSVVPCGSGGEVGIATVPPPLSPAHDEGLCDAWAASSISAEFLPFVAGASIALHTVEATSPTTGGRFEATCGQTWKHGTRCRLTRTSVGVRGQNEARGRPLGLLAAWLAGALCSEDADEHASAVPFLCFDERAEHRNALITLQNGADLAMLERPLREGESLEPQTSAQVACRRGSLRVWPLHVQCLYFNMTLTRCLQRREVLNT